MDVAVWELVVGATLGTSPVLVAQHEIEIISERHWIYPINKPLKLRLCIGGLCCLTGNTRSCPGLDDSLWGAWTCLGH